MDVYPIESGIPIPPQRCGTVRPLGCLNPQPPHHQAPAIVRYPFLRLQVSQSFFVPSTRSEPPDTIQNRVANRGRYHAQKYGLVFVSRRYADGVRVWRIE